MKKRMRFAALLVCALMLCSGMSAYAEAAGPEAFLSESALTLAKRIAGWQQTDLTNCELIPLSDDWSEFEVLTPDKPYIVRKTRYSPYSITVTPGTVLDTDAILDRYIGELIENGYPADSAEIVRKNAAVTGENGVCMIRIQQSAWKNHTILDSIKSCPNVERVQAQYGYSSYDYPNSPFDFRILFTWEDENLPEFPEFDILELKPLENDPTRYCMILKSADYADSLAALKALRTIDSMDTRPTLEYSTTELADERPEAREPDKELTTVFLRGDLSGDCTKDVRDAVLLARMVGGDVTVSALIADAAAADIDGSGKTDAEDLTLLLRQFAKLV